VVVRTAALLLAALALAGCWSRGFDRARLAKRLGPPAAAPGEEAIARALAAKPQLRYPMRLAVRFEPYRWRDARGAEREDRWPHAEVDALAARLEKLRAAGIVSDVVVVSDATVTEHDAEGTVGAARLAAARHQADAVLLVRGAADIDRWVDPLGLLYLTVIGLWVVPANHADALFVVDAALWDVGNGYLYLSADAEDTAANVGTPGAVEDGARVVEDARRKAVDALGSEVVERMLRLRDGGAG
jgi:hypothetical protein